MVWTDKGIDSCIECTLTKCFILLSGLLKFTDINRRSDIRVSILILVLTDQCLYKSRWFSLSFRDFCYGPNTNACTRAHTRTHTHVCTGTHTYSTRILLSYLSSILQTRRLCLTNINVIMEFSLDTTNPFNKLETLGV